MDHWIGMELGGYVLRRKIGEGAFGAVFQGVHPQSGATRAFKVARQNAAPGTDDTLPEWSTAALMDETGAIGRGYADPNLLLAKQFEALRAVGPPVYPAVDALFQYNNAAVMQMEFLEGSNLRQLMDCSEVTGDLLLKLAHALAELEKTGQSHGDLKPENILLTEGRAVLLDPGFRGELPSATGYSRHVDVTTPAYYPFRSPDDMTALGLILLEVATGVNPLRLHIRRWNLSLLRIDLAKRLAGLHRGNNYFFDAICLVSARTAIGEKLAASTLRPVILQALGLEFGPRLNEGPRYRNMAALEADLKSVLAAPDAQAPITCYECGRPARGEDRCPYCNAVRTAPACPHCGKPISPARNQDMATYHYAWNAGWDGRCAECGFEFKASLQLRTGHDPSTGLPGPALSIVQIHGSESEHADLDLWDRVPVVGVRVQRAEGSSNEWGLPRESQVVLTIEEWQAVFDQLQGPLKPLMERRGSACGA